MTLFQSIVLGVVQGITEFLPISSSGHLVLLQKLWHISGDNLTFIVLLHVGTLVAVIYAMRNEVKWLYHHPKSKLSWMILMALLPTAAIGALFEEWFEGLFENGGTLGAEFLITGVVLWWMDTCLKGHKTEEDMTTMDSLWIGALQGIAIMPALSRSGLTIAGGLWRKMSPDAAGRFSFLLSIPAILGATLMKLDDMFEQLASVQSPPFGNMLAGFLAAAIAGYIGVEFTLWLLRNSRMRIFAVYVWVLAAFVLSDQIFFHHFFPPLF
jgi:undecaprenyl-diphosphatase